MIIENMFHWGLYPHAADIHRMKWTIYIYICSFFPCFCYMGYDCCCPASATWDMTVVVLFFTTRDMSVVAQILMNRLSLSPHTHTHTPLFFSISLLSEWQSRVLRLVRPLPLPREKKHKKRKAYRVSQQLKEGSKLLEFIEKPMAAGRRGGEGFA